MVSSTGRPPVGQVRWIQGRVTLSEAATIRNPYGRPSGFTVFPEPHAEKGKADGLGEEFFNFRGKADDEVVEHHLGLGDDLAPEDLSVEPPAQNAKKVQITAVFHLEASPSDFLFEFRAGVSPEVAVTLVHRPIEKLEGRDEQEQFAARRKKAEALVEHTPVVFNVFQDVDANDGVGFKPLEGGEGTVQVDLLEGNHCGFTQTAAGRLQITVVDVGGQDLSMPGEIAREVPGAATDFQDAGSQVRLQHAVDPFVVMDRGGKVVQGLPLAVPGFGSGHAYFETNWKLSCRVLSEESRPTQRLKLPGSSTYLPCSL